MDVGTGLDTLGPIFVNKNNFCKQKQFLILYLRSLKLIYALINAGVKTGKQIQVIDKIVDRILGIS